MDSDLALVIGVVLVIFSAPAIMSAFADRRPPRVAALTLVGAGILLVWAISQQPGEFVFTDIPDAFLRVIARFLS